MHSRVGLQHGPADDCLARGGKHNVFSLIIDQDHHFGGDGQETVESGVKTEVFDRHRPRHRRQATDVRDTTESGAILLSPAAKRELSCITQTLYYHCRINVSGSRE